MAAETDQALSRALRDAKALVDLGVPVISGRLDHNGNPDKLDVRWGAWQRTRPNYRPIERWRNNEALGALTGKRFDVIDIDPRSGGSISFARMAKELGDNGPEVYWEVQTSSGGRHLYIAPLGIGGHNGFAPGLDLKADGGFVFIPPTIRPSKDPGHAGKMVRYRARTDLVALNGRDDSGDAIRDYITALLASKRGERRSSGGREELSSLETDCLNAERGEQHEALRRLVDELARTSGDDEYVLYRAWRIAQRMPAYDRAWPWTENDVRGLLHKPSRRPIPDATPEEEALLDHARPLAPQVVSSGLRTYADVERKLTRWLWYRYIAMGSATLLDGDAGLGKSLVTVDVAARLTTGRPMPGEDEVIVPARDVLMLAPEDTASDIRGRLEAAGADLGRVHHQEITMVGRRGKEKAYWGGEPLTFPEHTHKIKNWIAQANIGLVIIDPVAAYLSEKVNSSNDASVRRALEPLITVLGMHDAGALLIRHLNKDVSMKAAYRGGGSVAFGAVARVHLFAGPLPSSANAEAQFALTQIKNNLMKRRPDEALSYDILDSDIRANDQGDYVGRVEWGDMVSIPADVLAAGDPKRRGPKPEKYNNLVAAITAMLDERDPYPSALAEEELRERKLFTNPNVLTRAKDEAGVRSVQIFKRGGGLDRWVWTRSKEKLGDG